MSGKRGAEDEGNEEGILEASLAPTSTTFIGWMLTPEFRRHLLTHIPLDILLMMKEISKEFEATMRDCITRRVESGEMIFHRGVVSCLLKLQEFDYRIFPDDVNINW